MPKALSDDKPQKQKQSRSAKTSIGKKTQDSRNKRGFKSRSKVRHMKKNREKDA